MKKGALLFVAVLCLCNTGMAAQRKHHPWFAHSSKVSFPLVVEEAGGGGKKILASPHPQPSPPRGEGSTEGRDVVKQALRYKGTRYQYGGTTQQGLDCSGLVSRVWSDLKMKKIPRV